MVLRQTLAVARSRPGDDETDRSIWKNNGRLRIDAIDNRETKMRHPFLFLTIAVFAAGLGGCAGSRDITRAEVASFDAEHAAASEEVRAGIDLALADRDRGDGRSAAGRLETLLGSYESPDQAFEKAVLTALALQYLELGFRDDFLHAADRLEGHVSGYAMVAPETQYVLHLAQAMRGEPVTPIEARGQDPRLTQAIDDLL